MAEGEAPHPQEGREEDCPQAFGVVWRCKSSAMRTCLLLPPPLLLLLLLLLMLLLLLLLLLLLCGAVAVGCGALGVVLAPAVPSCQVSGAGKGVHPPFECLLERQWAGARKDMSPSASVYTSKPCYRGPLSAVLDRFSRGKPIQ